MFATNDVNTNGAKLVFISLFVEICWCFNDIINSDWVLYLQSYVISWFILQLLFIIFGNNCSEFLYKPELLKYTKILIAGRYFILCFIEIYWLFAQQWYRVSTTVFLYRNTRSQYQRSLRLFIRSLRQQVWWFGAEFIEQAADLDECLSSRGNYVHPCCWLLCDWRMGGTSRTEHKSLCFSVNLTLLHLIYSLLYSIKAIHCFITISIVVSLYCNPCSLVGGEERHPVLVLLMSTACFSVQCYDRTNIFPYSVFIVGF